MAFIPSEVFPPAATLLSFLNNSSHALHDPIQRDLHRNEVLKPSLALAPQSLDHRKPVSSHPARKRNLPKE